MASFTSDCDIIPWSLSSKTFKTLEISGSWLIISGFSSILKSCCDSVLNSSRATRRAYRVINPVLQKSAVLNTSEMKAEDETGSRKTPLLIATCFTTADTWFLSNNPDSDSSSSWIMLSVTGCEWSFVCLTTQAVSTLLDPKKLLSWARVISPRCSESTFENTFSTKAFEVAKSVSWPDCWETILIAYSKSSREIVPFDEKFKTFITF